MATYLIVPNDSCELSDELRKRIDNLFTKEEDKFYFFSSLNKKGKDELINNIFEDLSEEAQV